MNIQKLFKPYIVNCRNGQCQVLIPLVELDELCEKIVAALYAENLWTKGRQKIEERYCEIIVKYLQQDEVKW